MGAWRHWTSFNLPARFSLEHNWFEKPLFFPTFSCCTSEAAVHQVELQIFHGQLGGFCVARGET